jgi:hypothetical protein
MKLKDFKMSKVSKSPDRHTFQKNAYIERCKEEGKPINEDYISLYAREQELDDEWAESDEHPNDMEWDLRTTEWMLEKVRASDTYAQNLYAAICNNDFQKLEVMPILKEETWSASWRYAGGIIADMRQEGDYIDWYCSGIGGGLGNGDEDGSKGYVGESVVTDEIRQDLKRLGWIVVDWKNDE